MDDEQVRQVLPIVGGLLLLLLITFIASHTSLFIR